MTIDPLSPIDDALAALAARRAEVARLDADIEEQTRDVQSLERSLDHARGELAGLREKRADALADLLALWGARNGHAPTAPAFAAPGEGWPEDVTRLRGAPLSPLAAQVSVPPAVPRPLEEAEQAELFPAAKEEPPPLPAIIEQHRAIAEEHPGHVVLLRSAGNYLAYDKSAEVLSAQRQPLGGKPHVTESGDALEAVDPADLPHVINRSLECGWSVVVGEPGPGGAWGLTTHAVPAEETPPVTEPDSFADIKARLDAYHEAKRDRPGSVLLFYRDGCHEAYEADAAVVAGELGFSRRQEGTLSYARVPHGHLENSIRDLLRKGYPVAVVLDARPGQPNVDEYIPEECDKSGPEASPEPERKRKPRGDRGKSRKKEPVGDGPAPAPAEKPAPPSAPEPAPDQAEEATILPLRHGALEAAHLPSALRDRLPGQHAGLCPVVIDAVRYVVIHRSAWSGPGGGVYWELLPLEAPRGGESSEPPEALAKDTPIVQCWRDLSPGLLVKDMEGTVWAVGPKEARREVVTR